MKVVCCVYVGCLFVDTVGDNVRKMVLWRVLCSKKLSLVGFLRGIIIKCEPIMEKILSAVAYVLRYV